MNGRDYIISGSCDEHIVRICCAQTGRHLRDISLEVCQLSNLLNWQPSLITIDALTTVLLFIAPYYCDYLFTSMQGKSLGRSMFVQSLRGDPFRVSSVWRIPAFGKKKSQS